MSKNLRINKTTQIQKLDIADITDLQTTLTDLSTQISTHKDNKNNPHNVTKVQLGLENVDNTSDKNKPISDATQVVLDNLDTKITTHIENSEIHVTQEDKDTWTAKQDALTTEQQAAINSTITAEKVAKYEGYATSKQDKLTQGNHINIVNNTISVLDDLSTYDNSKSGFITKAVTDLNNYYTKTEINDALADKADADALVGEIERAIAAEATKQDKLTAGENITIVNNVISAKTYAVVLKEWA
jgi:hypothetical protein